MEASDRLTVPPRLPRAGESGPGFRALMTCSLHRRTIGSFHWWGSKVAQVTREPLPEATNINPVLGPLHCNSLDIASLPPSLPPHLTVPFHWPRDLLNTHLDRAGHLQKSRRAGQNAPSLSSLGDGAEPGPWIRVGLDRYLPTFQQLHTNLSCSWHL